MVDYTVMNTYKGLKRQLADYIKAQYLSNSDLLYDPISNLIDKDDTICRQPYLEATPVYEISNNGLNDFGISKKSKAFLKGLSEANLGVFPTPYVHQKKALEAYQRGNDIIVTTGTGSGKTECFLWPMLMKLANENHKDTWKNEGIRTLIIYPMNALVSDQVSRMRGIFNPHSTFMEIFNKNAGAEVRTPKFGMYTGRTPYPGEFKAKDVKDLGKLFYDEYVERDTEDAIRNQELINQLNEMGKIPRKYDFEKYAEELKVGNNDYIDERDMELLTRYEMQKVCPDIMITNYSMLEYMLIRPIEKSIWEKTEKWIKLDEENNKLMIILDEAHMYRGAPGGEIALLLKRLANKMNISSKNMQFILTSASVPEEADEEIKRFVTNLSGCDFDNIEIIKSVSEKLEFCVPSTIEEAQALCSVKLQSLYEMDKQESEIEKLFITFKYKRKYDDIKADLFDCLIGLPFMRLLLKECRSRACTVAELEAIVFGECDKELQNKGVEILIALGAIAKKESRYLLPIRSHIFMRGLLSVNMCLNSECNLPHSGDGVSVGNITVNDKPGICECGGIKYEVLVDRRCNGVFFKGYKYKNSNIVWNSIDTIKRDDYTVLQGFLIPEDYDLKKMEEIRKKQKCKIGYLNTKTGEFYESLMKPDEENSYAHVLIKAVIETDNTEGGFTTCPSCHKAYLHLTTLDTKGNEPFANVVLQQLQQQPINPKKNNLPNKGRKVLMFSDSRQTAAKLARDMTIISDSDTGRQVVSKSAQILMNEIDRDITMNNVYGVFVKLIAENDLSFFYGEDKEHLNEDIKKYLRRFKNYNIARLVRKIKGTSNPGLYSRQLLKQTTDSFRALHDLAIGYVCIRDEIREDLEDMSEQYGIDCDVLEEIINAWIAIVIVRDKAIGLNITDAIRRNIIQYKSRRSSFGLEEIKLEKELRDIVIQMGITEEIIINIEEFINDNLVEMSSINNKKYIDTDSVFIKVDMSTNWVYCKHCCSMFKFSINNKCIFCGSDNVCSVDNKQLSRLDLWRQPVINAIKEDTIKSYDIEEHTAQLTYLDKKRNARSTTEDYEMRFQDFVSDKNDIPVDILSCTTTMEVGIDIGSLTAVAMRNVPPARNNYQQRAGRAGRQSASVSTIVTYTGNNSHDSWYYHRPDEIVRGNPRIPWIDVNNKKLVYRHLTMIALCQYLEKGGCDDSVDSMFAHYFILASDYPSAANFSVWVKEEFSLSDFKVRTIIPKDISLDMDLFRGECSDRFMELIEMFSDDPDIQTDPTSVDNSNNLPTVLDILYREAILPTYSFPRNVVNFTVENRKGKIEQAPQRSIDIALSEYAPGRLIVINKKSYISGGLYSPYTRNDRNDKKQPAAAKKWLELKNYRHYYSYCTNKECNWMSSEKVERCPLCNHETHVSEMIKPWGFAPLEGKSIPESQDLQVYSSTSIPVYSSPSNEDELVEVDGLYNTRIDYRRNQSLMIINKGPNGEGFAVCELCGFIEPEPCEEAKSHRRPYKLYGEGQNCNGRLINNASLGYEYITDMVVLEVNLPDDIINNNLGEDRLLWIEPAVCTLTEAISRAAGKYLDIDFEDIKSGYRFRYSNKKASLMVEIFIYDKLVSGSGYSPQVGENIVEILEKASEVLDCTCESACPNCLENFRNRNIQHLLNRKAALQLLSWIQKNKLEPRIPLEEQRDMLKTLNEYLVSNRLGGVYISGNSLIIEHLRKRIDCEVYPCMWAKSGLRKDKLMIPDMIAKNALPVVIDMI